MKFNAFIQGVMLMPLMAIIIGASVWATHGWILIALPLMVPLTLFHDFIWWPSKTHCMTCIYRQQGER